MGLEDERVKLIEIELDIISALQEDMSIPAYLCYYLDGTDTVKDLIDVVCNHYNVPELKSVFYKKYEKILDERLEKYGFPIPC